MASLSIWTAALVGDVSRVESLLNRNVDASARDEVGYTAMHYAARQNQLGCAEMLIRFGADLNATTPGGATPIMRAAYAGHLDMVKLLLNAGARVDLRDSDGHNGKNVSCFNIEQIKVCLTRD